MKVIIEVDPSLGEDEVTIRCRAPDEETARLQRLILEQAGAGPALVFYKGDEEFYFPLGQVLFFETEGEAVWAHTAKDAYRIRHRLYALEEMLPRDFIRVAKSTIVNTAKIYSIKRELTAASQVSFADSHKQVFASRHYYGALRARMMERKEK